MKRLRCPACGEMLYGFKHRITMTIGQKTTEVEWLCENCDTEWVMLKGKGLVSSEEFERMVDNGLEFHPQYNHDAISSRKPRKLGNIRGGK